MIDAHPYLRVSSDEQVESGAGLAAQLDACRAYAAKNGWKLREAYEESEGVCGETPIDKRPALMRALESLKKGDVLLVAKRDRLMRDKLQIGLVELLLKKKKCRLVSAAGEGTDSDDPDDIGAFIQRGVVDLFAQYELMVIRLRVKLALAAKRRRNERTGQVPYGRDLSDDGRRSLPKRKKDGSVGGNLPIALVQNEAETIILANMLRLRQQGWTFDRITWALKNQGIVTKAGKPWQKSSVAHVLKRIESDPSHPARALLGAPAAATLSPTSSAS